MTDQRRDELSRLLNDIEQALRALNLWSSTPPPPRAFASTLPFFADCMSFEQWLQWVLVARFRALLEGNLPLPTRCQIAPMAEQSMDHTGQDLAALMTLLTALDALFDDAAPD